MRGMPEPAYQDTVPDGMLYVLKHADIRFAIFEDKEQVEKLLEIKNQYPNLEMIIYTDTKDMRAYSQKFLNDMIKKFC